MGFSKNELKTANLVSNTAYELVLVGAVWFLVDSWIEYVMIAAAAIVSGIIARVIYLIVAKKFLTCQTKK